MDTAARHARSMRSAASGAKADRAPASVCFTAPRWPGAQGYGGAPVSSACTVSSYAPTTVRDGAPPSGVISSCGVTRASATAASLLKASPCAHSRAMADPPRWRPERGSFRYGHPAAVATRPSRAAPWPPQQAARPARAGPHEPPEREGLEAARDADACARGLAQLDAPGEVPLACSIAPRSMATRPGLPGSARSPSGRRFPAGSPAPPRSDRAPRPDDRGAGQVTEASNTRATPIAGQCAASR